VTLSAAREHLASCVAAESADGVVATEAQAQRQWLRHIARLVPARFRGPSSGGGGGGGGSAGAAVGLSSLGTPAAHWPIIADLASSGQSEVAAAVAAPAADYINRTTFTCPLCVADGAVTLKFEP
jgi:hypothetical protein